MRILSAVLFALIALTACAQSSADCDWCGATEGPAALTSTARIAPAEEPGDRMVIGGTVYLSDGRTPARDVVIYLYHTNAKGIYPRRGNETGNARRHGYLRGWLRTDGQGLYRIESIRPGGYPGRVDPAHIHAVVKVDGKPELWINDFVFADDPRVRDKSANGVVTLTKKDGVWSGTRDIVLPK